MLVRAALLGLVQGVTEFLPVSSSAHLILARAFLGWDADQLGLAFDIACHFGTLAAVIFYFRRDLVRMDRRLAQLIAVGTVPILIAGVLYTRPVEEALRRPVVTIVTLTLGAIAFLWVDRVANLSRDTDSLTPGEALLLGCAQASALVPGVSRSGAVMVVAIFMGLRRPDAARFAFLLGIPAILAAGGKGVLEIANHGGLNGEERLIFLVGITVSAVVGYITVKYLIQYLSRHTLTVFVWYRLALAATVAIWVWS